MSDQRLGMALIRLRKPNISGVPVDGLIAAYSLDGNLLDSSGNDYNGSPITTISYVAAVKGQGIDGDGSNYVSLPNLGISGDTPRTISFWYKMGAATDIKSIVSWMDSGDKRTNNNIHCSAASPGDIYYGFSGNDYRTPGGVVNASEYRHVICKYLGGTLSASTVIIKVNNMSQTLTKAGSDTGSANTDSANYRLMSDLIGPRISDGFLDMVRIYNRALTDDEDTMLFNEG